MLIHLIYISIILILLAKIIKQGVRINGYEQEEDWDRIDNTLTDALRKARRFAQSEVENNLGKGEVELLFEKHPWTDGDCCRCAVCTKKYHDELFGDLETITDINHNLRNNK